MNNGRRRQLKNKIREVAEFVRRGIKWISPTIKEILGSVAASLISVYILIQIGWRRNPPPAASSEVGTTPKSDGAAPTPETSSDTQSPEKAIETHTPETTGDTPTPHAEESTPRFEHPVDTITPEPPVQATEGLEATGTEVATGTIEATETAVPTEISTISETPVALQPDILPAFVLETISIVMILTVVFLVAIVSFNRIRYL